MAEARRCPQEPQSEGDTALPLGSPSHRESITPTSESSARDTQETHGKAQYSCKAMSGQRICNTVCLGSLVPWEEPWPRPWGLWDLDSLSLWACAC